MTSIEYKSINGKTYHIVTYLPTIKLSKEVKSGFYNIGRLCRNYGKKLSSYITSDWFKALTSKISTKLYPNDRIRSFEELSFIVGPGKNVTEDYQGTYAHELYLIPLLIHLSNDTSFIVNTHYLNLLSQPTSLIEHTNPKNEINKNESKNDAENEIIHELTTPINRVEKSQIVIKKISNDNVYRITNDRSKKTIINDEHTTTISYINADDVYNILIQNINKYQDFDCITKITGKEYIIDDFGRFLKMIDEIKYNTFDICNYGIDINKNMNLAKQDIINKILSGKYNKFCLVGLLYEHFCLDFLKDFNNHKDIHLWKYLPQTFINSMNINRADYGKDIVDIKYNHIYQCKYYPNSTLTLDELYTFISEAEKYNERGFRSYLICPSSTEISPLVEDKFNELNIDIICYDAEDMNDLLKNNDIKMSAKLFNVMGYLKNNINEPFEKLLSYIREYYKSDYKEETLKTMISRLKKQHPELDIDIKTPISEIRKKIVIDNYGLQDIVIQKIIEEETKETFNLKSVERIKRELNQLDPEKYKLPYRSKTISQQINERLKELREQDLSTGDELKILQNEFPDFKLTSDGIQSRKQKLNLTKQKEKDNWDLQIKEIKAYIFKNAGYTVEMLMEKVKKEFNLTDDECRFDRVCGFKKQVKKNLKKTEIIEFDEKMMNDIVNEIRKNPHRKPYVYAKELNIDGNLIEQYAIEYNKRNPNNKLKYADDKRYDVYEFICEHPNHKLQFYLDNVHADRNIVKGYINMYNENHPDNKMGTTNKYDSLLAWMLMNPELQKTDYKKKYKCSLDPINLRLEKIKVMSEEEKQAEIEKYKNFNFDEIK